MKFKCTEIECDTDEIQANVPDVLIVDVDIDEQVSEAVTNALGFCHCGFCFEPFLDKPTITRLSRREQNVLNKIAHNSGMDRWFHISADNNGYFVYDLKRLKKMSLIDGIQRLCKGVSNCTNYGLTNNELGIFGNLLIGLLCKL